jgi:uncharacterized membrane protein
LALTINTGLGTNIKTTFSAPVVIPTLTYAIMTIMPITINALTISVVSVQVLTN